MTRLTAAAGSLAEALFENSGKVVFAESCTAGLVSASLATVPGISQHLCGSAVTYRERTKQDWLRVSAEDLAEFSAVSEPVTRQMAVGVLENTAEADYSASVTGHLGPDAPADQDGVIFVGIAQRREGGIECRCVERVQLEALERTERQREAAAVVLELLLQQIKGNTL